MATEVINPKVHFEDLHQGLIEKCISGDQKAQFQIYKLYYKAMYNTSLRIVNNTMEAEDIMQESFLSAFEKIKSITGTVSFGTWLRRIVINMSIDSLKRNGNVIFEDISPTSGIENSCIGNTTFDEDTTLNLKVQDLMDAIKRLPEGYRIILSLYLLEGFDHDEIGEILSISSGTSRSIFSKAKQILIDLIEE